LGTTGLALPRLFQKMSKMDIQFWEESQSFKVGFLSLRIGFVAARVADAGREVVNLFQKLIWLEQGIRQGNQIEPIQFSPAFTFHAKVKVKAVYIDHNSLHRVNNCFDLRVNSDVDVDHLLGFPYKI
jgi:hypothetical protein